MFEKRFTGNIMTNFWRCLRWKMYFKVWRNFFWSWKSISSSFFNIMSNRSKKFEVNTIKLSYYFLWTFSPNSLIYIFKIYIKCNFFKFIMCHHLLTQSVDSAVEQLAGLLWNSENSEVPSSNPDCLKSLMGYRLM